MAKHYGKISLSHLCMSLIFSVFSEGVVCDGCNIADFSDLRYKCVVCPNYDLCIACYNDKKETLNHLQSHTMIGIEPQMIMNETLMVTKHRHQFTDLEKKYISSK